MAEETSTQSTEQNEPAKTGGTTQPQAETVDMETIAKTATEAAEKKMQAVVKSMLSQQGLDADTISKMTAEFKAKQKTPEQIASEKDAEIARLTGLYEGTIKGAAVQKGLQKLGAKGTMIPLLSKVVDLSAISLEGETVSGVDEALGALKAAYPDAFEGEEKTKEPFLPSFAAKTGGQTEPKNENAQMNEVLRGMFKKGS